ncbi:Demethylmenaquinone methyltransferase 4 [Colletotrichum chlorophyti]|uniref:Demethylmenaquinone methyltransferase 4 n=1 Tax=Colletotrichum chlorophyti TaxID=708187 RepID=A0A1Q8RMD9_9PEZI|nr:Demethylmenaquinone methyltransferase 4 [Colletotrichum chlorophyti]
MSTTNDTPTAPSNDEAPAPRAVDEPSIVHEEEPPIVPDEEETDDSSSDIGSSVASSRTSLASSVNAYRIEHGRAYQTRNEDKYHYPIDERESDRLDLQHWLCVMSFDGKLGLAPPNDEGSQVQRVLDVGTGTGIWAIAFGDEHPDAEVIGVDLVPPKVEFVPPNVILEVDDIDEPWTYNHSFDYIHSRMMTSSISNWKDYLQKCFDNLSPGGYFEMQEADLFPQSDDGTLKPDAAIIKSCTYVQQACTIFGRPFAKITDLAHTMTEVGFEDVVVTKNKWPMNTWPKDRHYKTLGMWSLENYLQGIEGWTMPAFTKGLNWKPEEVQVFLVDVRKEMKDTSIHAYWPVYSIYGKKPTKK